MCHVGGGGEYLPSSVPIRGEMIIMGIKGERKMKRKER